MIRARWGHLDNRHPPVTVELPRQGGQQAFVIVDGAAVHTRGVLDQQAPPRVATAREPGTGKVRARERGAGER